MPSFICRCMLLALVFGYALPVWGQSAGKKVAMLVGVNQYQKRGFKNLDYAERDVTELEKELKKLGFRTVLLTGGANGDLKATRKNIDAQLLKLLSDTGKQDIVLVALSGHGQQLTVKGPNGQDRDDGFYCPYDAELGDASSLFSLSYLTDEILAKKGGRNLVLVDACRDPLKDPGRGARGVQGKIVSLPEDTALFFSCRAGQQSWESDDLKHGVFTYCLLEGLRGEAAKGNDIAWTNIVAHVEERMASVEMKKYLPKPQEPIPAGGVGRTVLGSLSATKPQPLVAPFSTAEAKAGQAAWAKHLGQPVTERNSVGIDMVLLPPGTFRMGSTTSDIDAILKFDASAKRENFAVELPQHAVQLKNPFRMGATEVTVGQFRKFVTATGYQTDGEKDGEGGFGWNAKEEKLEGRKPQYTWKNTGFSQTDSHPVVNVSWNDATAFVEWLSREEGKPYRLPTEAEWEYACRAGTTGLWWHGNAPEGLATSGNLADGTAKAQWGKNHSTVTYISARDGDAFTAAVGKSNRTNPFGLSDMHGNVIEWCQDWYDANFYAQAAGTAVDPTGPTSGGFRVRRGGGWGDFARGSRSAYRYGDSPDVRFYNFGFRVSRTP